MPSPLGSSNINLDTAYTLQNAAGATGNGTVVALTAADRELTIKAVGASAVLTILHEVSFDSGSNYENAFLEDLLAAGGIGTLINSVANPTTTRHRYRIPAGATNFRTRISAFVSGTVTVTGIVRTSA